ncbi:hypothetical protein QYE76_023827, partial [Lolium multiflorum]
MSTSHSESDEDGVNSEMVAAAAKRKRREYYMRAAHVAVMYADEIVNHVGRPGYPTQNIMAVCDFDMRFTSVVAGWPGSAHDTRIFKDTLVKYATKFAHPPK